MWVFPPPQTPAPWPLPACQGQGHSSDSLWPKTPLCRGSQSGGPLPSAGSTDVTDRLSSLEMSPFYAPDSKPELVTHRRRKWSEFLPSGACGLGWAGVTLLFTASNVILAKPLHPEPQPLSGEVDRTILLNDEILIKCLQMSPMGGSLACG